MSNHTGAMDMTAQETQSLDQYNAATLDGIRDFIFARPRATPRELLDEASGLKRRIGEAMVAPAGRVRCAGCHARRLNRLTAIYSRASERWFRRYRVAFPPAAPTPATSADGSASQRAADVAE